MPYTHRPMSSILAPTGDATPAPQTPAQQAPAAPEIPEKYRGKSVTDVIEMHRNSESRLGQLQNEVGQLRGLVSDLAQVQRVAPAKVEEKIDVKGDDLVSDPVGTIRKVLKHDLDQLQQSQAEDNLRASIQRETDRLHNDFDVVAMTSDPAFQAFATRTVSRQMDLQTAISGGGLEQVRAARRLLEDYKDFQSASPSPQQQTNTAVDRAKAASNAAPTSAGVSVPQTVLHEADVLNLIQTNPEKYRSPSFQRELHDAIRTGRYVKS